MLSRYSLVLILALLAFAVSLPTNDGDAWEEHTPAQDDAAWIQAMVSSMAEGKPSKTAKLPATVEGKGVKPLIKEKKKARARAAMLDAGSQGTKIFTWNSKKMQMPKVFFGTQCMRAGNTKTNKGLAALSYPRVQCDQETWAAPDKTDKDCQNGNPAACISALGQVKAYEFERPIRCTNTAQKDIVPYTDKFRPGTKKDDTIKGPADDEGMRKSYRDHLLGTISTYVTSVNGVPASNKDHIPLLATAGMRLVKQSLNKDIYTAVCGPPLPPRDDGHALAPEGKYCKTLAGTEEAYYEYLAMATGLTKEELAKRGMFTMGGASGQIGIPLTAADVLEFKKLIAAAKANPKFDCTTFKISMTDAAPFFHSDSKAGAKGCLPDYLDMRLKADMPKTVRDKLPADMVAVGLISFLNTKGQKGGSILMAGGKNEVANWAKKACASAGSKSFANCQKKLSDKLALDPLWTAVTTWFKTSVKDVTHFSFTTDNSKWSSYAAPQVPKDTPAAAAATIKATHAAAHTGFKAAPGTSLAKEVEDTCKTLPDVNADAAKESTVGNCMQALWASLYITSFFGPVGSTDHPESEATDNSHGYDWSDGARADDMLKLLQTPLSRGNHYYMDGVSAELGY